MGNLDALGDNWVLFSDFFPDFSFCDFLFDDAFVANFVLGSPISGCGGGEDATAVIVTVFPVVAIANVFYLPLEFFVFLD